LEAEAAASFRRLRRAARFAGGSLAGVGVVAILTYYGYALHANGLTMGFLYLLAVLLAAMLSGFAEATVTSVFAVACLNYFFVPPVLSFEVAEPENWFGLAAFESTALAVSRLSTRVRDRARAEARERRRAERLYELSRRILFLDRRQTVGPRIVSLIQEAIGADAVALFDATAARVDSTHSGTPALEEQARTAYVQDLRRDDESAGTCQRPLRLGKDLLGGLALQGRELDRLTADAAASLTAITLERARSFDKETRAEAARQSEQLRTAVLDSLAHAFKTPLTTIRTASSGLLELGNLDQDNTELATLIDEQSRHLDRLTTDLLQMARIDAAEVRIHRQLIPVTELIEEVLDRNREQLAGPRFEVLVPPDGFVVDCDRALLGTALLQLFDNAAKYSTPGSPITVTAAEDDGEVVVSVHNEGPAIPLDDRERIFERFYRAPGSKHRAAGTGLGLSIAKKTAEAHRGRVWVVSEESKGTTFFFAMPKAVRRDHEPVSG
jgi:two-component system sensor histidine kinase KdpD